MIKKFLIFTSVMFSLSLMTISSCQNSTSENSTEEQTDQEFVYICPMDCEDGKTYEDVLQCPVCEMNMDKVEKE